MKSFVPFLGSSTLLHVTVIAVMHSSFNIGTAGLELKKGMPLIDMDLVMIPAAAGLSGTGGNDIARDIEEKNIFLQSLYANETFPTLQKERFAETDLNGVKPEVAWNLGEAPSNSAKEKLLILITEAENISGCPQEKDMEGHNVIPRYPRMAVVQGWEGETVVSLSIDKVGYIENIQLVHSSGYGVLDQSVLNTLSHWKFGCGQARVFEIPFRFILRELNSIGNGRRKLYNRGKNSNGM